MQIASRQNLWADGGRGTVIEVEMTPETGLYIRFGLRFHDGLPVVIDWGDRSAGEAHPPTRADYFAAHTYPAYGRYRIVFENLRGACFRYLDGQPQYSYDKAPVSFVDYAGTVETADSGSFKKAVNLERFIAPNVRWVGQRPFAYCAKLKEAVLGEVIIHYDGSFQNCSELEKFTTKSTGICWSYVWQGCTKLRELRLGAVSQFATQDFMNCPNLMDIHISDKTVAQVTQTAPGGNIVAGYGARFPWNANPETRFHCIDGIVLGNGTIID